ncbi:MAG TPA: L-threonylcarbamoyladenylate synthase [Acidimicrobiia bacterium]|jgi:tRNA threonylcarbamoyl adenosine modification protein (Sua5/YciO/YrdC/YwlC family)|nr:L-threonylcarbamoyladenylate synthase [Acidimicrobiia bacterium]
MRTIDEAIAALRDGEIVGVPTDTLYGLAADPFREDALDAIFDLKGRPTHKPLAILCASVEQGMTLASFSDRALELAERHWPGALTLVLPRLDTAPDWLGHQGRRTVGLRCPDHPVALELLERSGPLVVTSANLSGHEAVLDDEEAAALFGEAVAVYLEGTAPGGQASTIIDLTEPDPLTLRDGPV